VVENEAAAAQCLKELLDAARGDGRNLYAVPVGGSNAVGALGYVGCALELMAQTDSQGLDARTLVNATSSLGTQAGLVVGFHAAGSDIAVRSVNVSAPDEKLQASELRQLCDDTATLLDVAPPPDDRLHIESGFRGDSYGVPTDAMHEAVECVARHEGILLDPVYTGKAMAWLMDAIRGGRLDDQQPVIFLHSGGSPGLFAYQAYLSDRLAR
jgi:1-aminocyclopropane-1-carboxylate deaminase/D-cysteine desulfhydrase-like pyridoxal-dependent ACC family enzyme